MIRRAAIACVFLALLGVAPPSPWLQLDSQLVLQRYATALNALDEPKAMIFSYSVSQLGPANIEQRHRIYRSGTQVRDELIAIDGVAPRTKIVTITRREDRYAIGRLAPRDTAYTFLFLRAHQHGGHLDYEYETTPIVRSTSGFIVERVTIDGARFLPHVIRFQSRRAGSYGNGALEYGSFGAYWMPVAATVTATVDGHPAREHIAWGEYRFPASLPDATFVAPRALPATSSPSDLE